MRVKINDIKIEGKNHYMIVEIPEYLFNVLLEYWRYFDTPLYANFLNILDGKEKIILELKGGSNE